MNNYVDYDQVQDMTQTVIDGTLLHENSDLSRLKDSPRQVI